MNLASPIDTIQRIGPAYRSRLRKLGIQTVRDLLFHVPCRYEDYSRIVPISSLGLDETVTIRGEIFSIENTVTWKKRMHLTKAIIRDDSGAVQAVWFNQPYIAQNLKEGMQVVLSGKTTFSNDSLTLSNPAYEALGDKNLEEGDTIHTGRLVPIYPETAGVTSRWFRYMIKNILPFAESLPEYLPNEILERQQIPPLNLAISDIHFPSSLDEAQKAKKRLAFGELFLIQTIFLKEKLKLRKEKAPLIPLDIDVAKKFVSALPFQLTDSQRKTAWEIMRDFEKPYPMNRLLEGDVGSGKTVVAALVALQTIKAGYQVAFMVPTEILGEQHFKELSKLLNPYGITLALLTRSAHKKTSQKILYAPFKISKARLSKETEGGKIDIVLGTHTLIQETVRFKNLGLIIIDEQHRFGVHQRMALARGKTQNERGHSQKTFPRYSASSPRESAQQMRIPHLLSMTATPIPRTLSLALYGDLELSLIKELPKGRKQIITKIIPPPQRQQTYEFIRQQVAEGRQAFVICPLIEESEKLEAKAATKEYEKLQKQIFPDLKIALLHGKMKGKEKERIMTAFKEKESDILVSTSVVEVGIDIPNAAIMMIEGAERFGLAQLYQFRGRVGRAEHQSYCFLFTDSTAKSTGQRLKALVSAKNSFELAEKDLEIRGPGDFIGTRQSGMPDFVMASLNDLELVQKARNEAEALIAKDPELACNPLLCKKYETFRREVHFE